MNIHQPPLITLQCNLPGKCCCTYLFFHCRALLDHSAVGCSEKLNYYFTQSLVSFEWIKRFVFLNTLLSSQVCMLLINNTTKNYMWLSVGSVNQKGKKKTNNKQSLNNTLLLCFGSRMNILLHTTLHTTSVQIGRV